MFVGKTIPLKLVLALGVSFLAAGAHAQVCEIMADGSACGPLECSDIPEEQCLATVLHVDMATGAITPLACECIDYSHCHIEFGDASPFAVGGCPDGTPCVVVASDSNGDGIDDEFTAVCHPGDVGGCCLDIDDGPIGLDTCVELTSEACQAEGGVFQGVNSGCWGLEPCCMGGGYCAELINPFCCIFSGGVPLGPGSTCPNDPPEYACGQHCGGIASIPCENEDDYCRFPNGCLCCDLMGVCMPIPTECPTVWAPVCGCDGVTYENECKAAAAGMSVDHLGSCEDRPCGGLGPYPPCEPDEFCDVPPGTCGDPSVIGVCRPIPSGCPNVWDPVCGCDGVTYGNACEAHAAGVSIAHPGECGLGACCMPDEPVFPPCLLESEAVCADLGGEFQGPGTACPTDPAQPCGLGTGACCLNDPNGTLLCIEATEEGCAAEGGHFLGPGSLCPSDGTDPCGPTGACCLADAGVLICLETTVVSCLQGGGTYHGDGTTCPADGEPPCPPPVGACCLPDGMCIEVAWEACLAEGGDPYPTGEPCDAVLCGGPALGACCLTDPAGTLLCIEATEEGCAAEGGKFLGPGTVCPPDGTTPCEAEAGACCFPNGDCLDLQVDVCMGAGGEHLPGASCNIVDCPGDPVGACCIPVPGSPDGLCTETTEAECVGQGGVYEGDWTSCADDGRCGQPTGACCVNDASNNVMCFEGTEQQCFAQGGVFQGAGSACPSDPNVPCGTPCPAVCPPDWWCFSECGVLVAGVECILFQADSGGVFLVGNLGGFVVGDRVHVTGCATHFCVSICMQGNGCIADNVIGPCGEQVCGGIAGIPCDAPDSFCKYPVGTCGMDDIFGVCTPVPGGCFDPREPVCGCDGVTYGDECEADAAGVSIAHPGECPVFCEPLDAGFGCVPNAACGLIPEDQCLVREVGWDHATNSLITTVCECLDFNLCHLELTEDGMPIPVGSCPTGSTCELVAHDPDGDGLDDRLAAECVPYETGICCGDIGGSPLPVPVCVEVTPDACGGGGIFGGVGTTCDPAEACCMNELGAIYCLDIHPFCCAVFGGAPQGPNSTCVDIGHDDVCVPQVCGGIAGIQCDEGWFCDYPVGTCNISDRDGVCRLVPPGCPDVWDPVCSCDGVTYGNACEAHMAGASIDHWGECGPACCDPREAPPCIEGPFCCGDGHWTCGDGGGTTCEAPGEVCENICGGIAGIPCFGDDFCKFPEGTCGMFDIFGVCTPIPGGGCPENYDPVCGCNGITYGNECEADAAGVSIAHRGECPGGECAATRTLSDPDDLAYCPGVTKRVHIALNPPAGTSAVGVEDAPPAGWVVSSISDGGTFDFVNWKVKWGPLFPPFPAEVTYEVTPTDVAGVECFTGTISIDGVNESICGDQCVDACCPHMRVDVPQPACPACPVGDCESCDGSCADGQVSMCELVGYACSWTTGCNDDLGGMTRAAYVWRNGECYCWDDAEQNWFPSACGDSSSTCCEGGHQGAGGSDPSVGASWTADAQLRPIRRGRIGGFRELKVPITIEAPEGTSAMALECEVPQGWQVTDISDGGVWDELHRKVKWGPFMDNLSRRVSFKARRLDVVPTAKSRRLRGERRLDGFAGTVSFDGVNHPLTIE